MHRTQHGCDTPLRTRNTIKEACACQSQRCMLRIHPWRAHSDPWQAVGRASTSPPGASKGFGSTSAAKPTSKAPSKKQLRKAPKGAIRGGRIDLVEVQDWGSGNQSDLGELKIKKAETVYGDTPGTATASESPSAATDPSQQIPTPYSNSAASIPQQGGGRARQQQQLTLFEQLCQEMAMAEKRGALAIAGPTPPPVETWSFTRHRYQSYLMDCLSVHTGLEDVLQAATALAGTPAGSQNAVVQVLARLGQAGLQRSAALQSDMAALNAHQTAQSTSHAEPLNASISAQSTKTHLQRLARDIRGWASAADSHSSSRDSRQATEAEAGGIAAAEQALAWAFSVYTLHAAGGMRFGAMAAEKLRLLEVGAARLYSQYPESVKDPLRTLRDALDAPLSNAPGLTSAQRRRVLAAVPNALRDASRLLDALAHTD